MSSAAHTVAPDTFPRYATEEEYLRLDAEAPHGVKYEYLFGRIYTWNGEPNAMAGGRPEHSHIGFKVARALDDRITGNCIVFNSDLQVQTERTVAFPHNYVYPDVSLACDPKFDGVRLTNPILLVEVLSDSTARKDTHHKVAAYFTIPSVQEYWVFAQDMAQVIQYYRSNEGISLLTTTGRQQQIAAITPALRALGLDQPIQLEDVYAFALRDEEEGSGPPTTDDRGES